MSWTDERVTLLKKLWGEGKTAAEIAKALGGVTRNAVIGKAHRLKLSNRISPIQQNERKEERVPEVKKVPKAIKTAIAVTQKPANNSFKGLKMIELKERMCRWPSGDPKDEDFSFCGCTSVPGLPYCEDHAKMAYQVATRSRTLKAEDFDDAVASVLPEDDLKEVVNA
jgi:GcrA cell cycle regulator